MLIKELNELKKISKNGIINFNDNGINQFPLANMNNYLTKIMKGWYFFHNPNEKGSTVIWQNGFYNFLQQYLKKYCKNDYILSAESSLDLILNETTIKQQLIFNTNKNLTNFIKTEEQNYSFVITKNNFNQKNIKTKINGLNAYPIEIALLEVNESYFKNKAIEAETALKMIIDPKLYFTYNLSKNSKKLGKIIGAYEHLGMNDFANEIRNLAKQFNINPICSNPFDKNYVNQLNYLKSVNPSVIRITQKYKNYEQILLNNINFSNFSVNENLDFLLSNINKEFT